jgi:hypothetical protein
MIELYAHVRDHDTVDIRKDDGEIFCVFTCDSEVAARETDCWMAVLRTNGSTRSALEYLLEGWSRWPTWTQAQLAEPPRLHVVPKLLT